MPQLFEPMFVETVKMRFRSFNVTLPTMVSTAPKSSIGQYLMQNRSTAVAAPTQPKAIAVGTVPNTIPGIKLGGSSVQPTRPTATPQNVPPALFRAASNDKEDVDFQTEATNELSNYITAICHTIVGAHDNWRYTAFLKGVIVIGPLAIGGSISGPLLSENMNIYGPQQGLWGNAGIYTRAIADGLASCWRDWERSVRLPGLPWYPAFAAYPLPNALPMPNLPSAVNTFIWSPTALMPNTIKTTIARKLSQPVPYSDELFTAIADGFVSVVSIWFASQNVMYAMGGGPVPSYAPPYVPVGPVNGSIVEKPPHFST